MRQPRVRRYEGAAETATWAAPGTRSSTEDVQIAQTFSLVFKPHIVEGRRQTKVIHLVLNPNQPPEQFL